MKPMWLQHSAICYICASVEVIHESTHWISNLLTEWKKETKDIFIYTDDGQQGFGMEKPFFIRNNYNFFMQIVQEAFLFANEDAIKDFWK